MQTITTIGLDIAKSISRSPARLTLRSGIRAGRLGESETGTRAISGELCSNNYVDARYRSHRCAPIEMSLSIVSVGEHWADDGDYDEAHVHSHHVDLSGRFSAAMQHDMASTNGYLNPVTERGPYGRPN